MYVILPSHEIPHEIPPVHPAELEIEEELHVLHESRLLIVASRHSLALAIHVALVEPRIVAALVVAPHPREEHFARWFVDSVGRAIDFLVLSIQRRPIGFLGQIVVSPEILAVQKRLRTVLLAVQVAHQSERIIWLVLIGRGLRARTDDHDAEQREPDEDCRKAQQSRVPEYLHLLQRLEQSPEAKRQKSYHEEGCSRVVRQA